MREKNSVYIPLFSSVIMILLVISESILKQASSNGANYYLASAIIQLFIYMLPLAFYCKVRNINFFTSIKFNLFSPGYILFVICAGLIFFIGIIILKFVGYYYLDGLFLTDNVDIITQSGTKESIYIALGMIVMPAVLQEILFRGIVISEYRSYGAFWSLLMSSLLFAMTSMSYDSFPMMLYVGLMFGMVTIVTNSALPAIVLHLLYNVMNVYLRDNIIIYMKKVSDSIMPLFVLGACMLILIFLTFSVLESIYQRKAAEEETENKIIKKVTALDKIDQSKKAEKGKGFIKSAVELILSPTFLVAAAIFILAAAMKKN